MIRLISSFALSILATATTFAASPVRDINATTLGTPSPLNHWTTVGDLTFFVVGTDQFGEELWRTDGTRAGTRLVKDIYPGPDHSGITSMRSVNGLLYFFADDGTNGHELWRSDGTTSGTRIVADITPGPDGGATSSELVSIGDIVYFPGSVAGDSELWRSNGTASGTWPVSDICRGECASYPEQLTVVGSRLFFLAADEDAGSELWSSDGTASGTRRVVDIQKGREGSDARHLTATSAGLFFVARNLEQGNELWFATADGRSARIIRDMSPGPASSTFSPMGVLGADVVVGAVTPGNPLVPSGAILNLFRASGSGRVDVLAEGLPLSSGVAIPAAGFVQLGSRLLFSGSDPASPGPLWATDGTSTGTGRLGESANLVVTTLIGGVEELIVGNEYFFQAQAGGPGNEIGIWRTDGSEAGTVQHARLPQPFIQSDMAYFNGRVFFAGGFLGSEGSELWSTDGTDSGTALFADLVPGALGSTPALFTVAGGRLLFTSNYTEPWSSDGTVDGTQSLLPNLPKRTAGSDPQRITSLGDRVVFVADDGVHGAEPWLSDGSAAGTLLLRDIYPGAPSSHAIILGSTGSRVFFSAFAVGAGKELWVTDGTSSGTYQIRDIRVGTQSSDPAPFAEAVVLNNVLYFPANDGVSGEQLWRSDGTFTGTYAITNLPGNRNWCFKDLRLLQGRFLFPLCEESEAWFWWQTDGTAEGTSRISNAVNVASSAGSVVVDGWLYFSGQSHPITQGNQQQLWRTNGTEAGTTQVTNLAPSAGSRFVSQIRAMPGRVLFRSCATGMSCSVYASDGTSSGTQFVTEDSISSSAAVAEGRLVYVTSTPDGRPLLRSTDGTAAGTRDVLSPRPADEVLASLTSIGSQVLFTRVDPVHGPSVWRTDGTSASTVLVADLDPGIGRDYLPDGYTVAGGRVFLQGFSASSGRELYVISPDVPNAGHDTARTAYGEAVTVLVAANDGTMSGTINASSIAVASAPQGGTVSPGPEVGTFVYTPNAGFEGADHFTYTIADMAGTRSQAATVFITVALRPGPAPGSASNNPFPNPIPAPQTPSDRGGGGATSMLALLLLALMKGKLLVQARRRFST